MTSSNIYDLELRNAIYLLFWCDFLPSKVVDVI